MKKKTIDTACKEQRLKTTMEIILATFSMMGLDEQKDIVSIPQHLSLFH
jgi:hypothetical protein